MSALDKWSIFLHATKLFAYLIEYNPNRYIELDQKAKPNKAHTLRFDKFFFLRRFKQWRQMVHFHFFIRFYCSKCFLIAISLAKCIIH